jgi:hypothetical protein
MPGPEVRFIQVTWIEITAEKSGEALTGSAFIPRFGIQSFA